MDRFAHSDLRTRVLTPGYEAARARIAGSSDRLIAVGVGCVGTALLSLFAALVRGEPRPRGDDLIYERMASHPLATHTFPFGYRVGLPLAVHALPFGHEASFVLLALLAAGGAAAFAFLLMRALAVAQLTAAALAVLLCISPPFVVVLIRHGRNTDIATAFFMMAATYYAVRRDRRRLAVALLLGTATREAVLFIAPLSYALWATRVLDRRAACGVLATAAPAIVTYLLLRLGLHTVGKARVPGYGGALIGERLTVLEPGLASAPQELRRMFTIYGPLWLVAPLALPVMPFARRGLILVALSVVAMTFALDWGRMILLAAPVFYPAAAAVLGRMPRWRAPVSWVWSHSRSDTRSTWRPTECSPGS
jgi:hypothetical protein